MCVCRKNFEKYNTRTFQTKIQFDEMIDYTIAEESMRTPRVIKFNLKQWENRTISPYF